MPQKKLDESLNSFLASWESFTKNRELKPNRNAFDWRQQFTKVRNNFIHVMQTIEPDLPQMQSVEDLHIECGDGPIPGRVYTPYSAKHPVGPALVFFHGGGFVMGDLESYDSICRRLADASGCRILSVEYRLAPEHKFPAQVNDAVTAFKWAVENAEKWGADRSKIAAGGDSAGGNLTMVVTRAAQNGECPAPVFQLLIYPLAQFVDLKEKGVSLQEGSFFSPAAFEFCRSAYLEKDQNPLDLRISPLFYSNFQKLPPAHVITAGWDPLRDEGRIYADKLVAAGVKVTHKDYQSHPHGFFNSTAVSKSARDAIVAAGKVLKSAINS
ncbi:alpha/beta hydrolase [Hirschia baltica]|uniref:Alpha/beta hydrolase fold-3 domain protein n=1 Tax=Hirschia baltica (strain ATCC 49814 / DSM 5838 / IFAM 1418) TaxID=582402 RepID=C6XKZ6_HIRBI|nr:alpha/beta hydrolase [Hirschia baltica]ACT57825.1 Alpha/beta hydrolase fold-3 domain protein [Hirschia baltica ATCC 49814]